MTLSLVTVIWRLLLNSSMGKFLILAHETVGFIVVSSDGSRTWLWLTSTHHMLFLTGLVDLCRLLWLHGWLGTLCCYYSRSINVRRRLTRVAVDRIATHSDLINDVDEYIESVYRREWTSFSVDDDECIKALTTTRAVIGSQAPVAVQKKPQTSCSWTPEIDTALACYIFNIHQPSLVPWFFVDNKVVLLITVRKHYFSSSHFVFLTRYTARLRRQFPGGSCFPR